MGHLNMEHLKLKQKILKDDIERTEDFVADLKENLILMKRELEVLDDLIKKGDSDEEH